MAALLAPTYRSCAPVLSSVPDAFGFEANVVTLIVRSMTAAAPAVVIATVPAGMVMLYAVFACPVTLKAAALVVSVPGTALALSPGAAFPKFKSWFLAILMDAITVATALAVVEAVELA